MTISVNQQKKFRRTLGQFATGVVVITALDKNRQPAGMTVSSFNSVSLEPMLILWSLAKSSSNYQTFTEAEHFAIHVLGANQEELSRQFSSASKDLDKFSGVAYRRGLREVPILNEYSALFQCKTETLYDGGDHIIIIGEVVDFDDKPQAPLIFFGGHYAELTAPI